jgi:hypothetical protein
MSRTGDFTSSALEEDDVLDVGGAEEQSRNRRRILFDIK